MKKLNKHKKRILKRLLSFTLALVLAFSGLPLEMVSEDIAEHAGVVMSVKAAEDLDAEALAELTAKYSANSYAFTSGGTELSEYSQCFQDNTWAASHANDIITLNPVANKFIFDANYRPIGNENTPFSGTIIYNTSANDFAVDANSAIFNYVTDSVTLGKMVDEELVNIPLNINRVADVGDTISPLLAVHIVGSDKDSPYEWKVTLNSASARSYSGIIYEMTDGAKVNLTFADESSHTPQRNTNNEIISGSIIDNKESGKNYGILCGSLNSGSTLQCTYTKTNDDDVTFIGIETAYSGGLVGEINNSTFEILSGSSALKVDFQTPKTQVGFICGHAEGSTITLPTGYGISGSIDGNTYAGGIAGYCKNTVIDYETASGTIALSYCEIKNGTTTGGVFGYYECDNSSNDILLTRTYNLTNCKVEGTGLSGGIAGEYKCAYTGNVTIDLNDYSMDSTTKLITGTSAGGLFGKYTANGSVMITDSDTANTHFAPPSSSVPFGGIIGEYVNNAYANTLTLTDFTVNDLSCTSTGMAGGVIRTLTGSTYVSVINVNVTNVTANSATYFGGIISELDNNNAGSFIDVSGNYSLSMATGKTYKGGAIAGSFKKGVIRLAGVTDISGAKAENGYAQLVYENDETLVYAKGSGSDANWTLKRNASTTASNLGQWGEVVRLFKVGGTYKNAEDAGIVSVANNKVTIASVTADPAINDEVSFAKVALNMQLNDGSDHGALCFASGGANKTSLLSSNITVSGEIDLSGTGLLGFMRDGGNGKYLKTTDNSFTGSPDFFTGSISGTTGSSTDKILLAIGEAYGCDASGNALSSDSTGGRIYLSNNFGHDAQGLISFGKGASFSNLTVGGTMHVSRVDGSDHLYMAPLIGAMTNGATLTNDITVNTSMTIDRAGNNKAKFYIGGVSGVFDGKETTNNPYSLSITGSTIVPSITLTGSVEGTAPAEGGDTKTYDNNNTYAGGVLGLLKGSDSTQYNVSISTTDVSPTITIGDDVTSNPNYSYIGGMIGRVRRNATNERTITLNTVTMTGASVDTRAKYSGGLLGAWWERTNLTVDGLTITGSTVNSKYSNTGSKQSGLVFKGSGKWDINSLTIQASSDSTPVNTSFSSTDTAPVSFGLIVNEAYSEDDGLYINLLNRGYTLNGVTVPTSSTNTSYYVDEIAADTKNNDKNSGDILVGGNGTGVININMNTAGGAFTKIVDSETPANGTGTYQNRLYSQLGNLVGNQNSRYYYNLDVMMSSSHTKTDGEKFLLWSVNQYAASNISSNFSGAITGITDIKLDGLSYYPIPGGDVTLPTGATVTFGFNVIHDYENTLSSADTWKRFPEDTGAPKSERARNQHYLMQTGLFTTVSSLSASNLTLTGDFGYVANVASGALINDSTSGSVSLSGLTLDGLTPSNAASYLLINYINGTGTATPSLTLSDLRATNYSTGLPVAKSLFGKATGQNMTMTFGDIKLDARDGETISGTGWDATAAAAMTDAYGTSRSIFSDAIFFTELWAAKTCNMEYNYAVEKDWNTATGPREVTYGKEITVSQEYQNGEKHYYLVGENDGNFTNPISNSNTEFNFSAGFLPYVGNYTSKGTNTTYPVNEIKVNYKAPGLTVGCGTYNDPYIISTANQLNTIAKTVNGVSDGYPSTIRLPNVYNADHVITSWHDDTKGDGIYNHSGSYYNKASNNTNGVNNNTWTEARVRYYLASAYYKIEGTFTLADDFPGIGVPIGANNTNKGNTVFHGVIVGDSTSKPTITNPTNNPLIVVANGAVVKNINITNTGTITRTQDATGDLARYGYGIQTTKNGKIEADEKAQYYGGVIGEIMGGDNIIDDVTVTYSGTTTLDGSAKHLIAEGGMVGAVVNGALIFRGSNTVTRRTVTGGGIYSNPFVGRVINGYAVYESISGRTGSAPDNYNTKTITGEGEEEQVTKTYTYPIDTIYRSNENKLDVNWDNSTITVPDAQALYVMSLITQSVASTSKTDGNNDYDEYSPSYGYKSYLNGVARLGDYTDVGCGSDKAKDDYADYSNYACLDSVNNYTDDSNKSGLMWAPIPYIIYQYTQSYNNDAITLSKNYPARKMTSDNTKFWDITLSKSNTFASMDGFKAFRGIGCVGINSKNVGDTSDRTAFKVATFDGGGNTINLHISLPRYDRDKENYYHSQNKSLNQVYSGDSLGAPYGHDGDANLPKLMGLGLFDCVMVKNDSNHKYQFKNFTLQGIIEDKVYNTAGVDITGTTGKTQLFCVGGVYGKRIFKNASDVNFQAITFDGLTISCAYSCGGLVGIDAVKSVQTMKIDGCNSTENGISVTGGCYGENADLRHGVGSFVGMTFWTRPYIDGDDATTQQVETADISVSNVSTFYDGDTCASVAGGLIGYTGSGAEIKNVILNGLGTNPVIGSTKVLNAGGFIGFSQADNSNTQIGFINFDNCTLNGISVQAKNNAAGFLARCGNNTDTYFPRSINMSNCAVIGNPQNKPEIRAYGTNTSDKNRFRFGAGGFFADFSLNKSAAYGVIENCYIRDYLIEGSNVGGIIGTENIKPAYLKNIYVKDCNIITTLATGDLQGNIGGMVGRSAQNISGYNLKIDGVDFYRRSGNTLTDVTTTDAGIIIGRNSSSLVDKFIAICAYHTDASKVPTSVVKTNGTNDNNFFVFADYLNASAADITAKTGYSSSFGNTNTDNNTSNVTQPLAPYVNVAPHMSVGTSEYLTGDGASIGKAGAIYQDIKTGTSNRRYAIGSAAVTDSSVGNTPDATTLAKYINNDGTYKSGVFKISTAYDEFGEDFEDLTDMQNFAMLVINDDADKTGDITPFIKSYIRLVTNASGQPNQFTYNVAAYSCGNTNINALYQIVINPCYYDATQGKFVLGTTGNQGLQLYGIDAGTNAGKYWLDSTKADSESDNPYQFSLIDVQFKDPTDSTKIAYHLYVPVYTKKMLTAEFSAVTMSETKYYRSPYASRIASELTADRTAANPSQLVESTNEWTTTFIRYTYPKNQISQDANWNYDKSIQLTLDSNFQALPKGTELILIDPNANADKYYTMTLDGSWTTGDPITLNLSAFKDASGNGFVPQNLSAIYADAEATGTEAGKAVLYEDYYISMYVPKAGEGFTHSVLFSTGSEMSHTIGDDVYKSNIEPKLYSLVVLGDLFEHKIIGFDVISGDGSTFGDSREMSEANNVLKTNVTATVQIKNQRAGAYLANSNVYHSFFITLTSHDEDHKVSDIIYGITGGYINNETTYSYTNSSGNHEGTINNNSSLGANFIELDTGSIISAIYDPTTRPVLTIQSETYMTFNDVTAFPYNVSGEEDKGIGTQVSIKSSLAYRQEDLRFSALNKREGDPEGAFYYSTTKNTAELSFNAVPTDDTTDEIGYKTNNRSLLGVNGKYGTSHPVIGKSMYNVDDIVDYESATHVQYTIELYKKVTDENGTRYVRLTDISHYMTDVNMEDTKVTLVPDRTDKSKYVYTGEIDHDNTLDNERMFEATFSCNVLTGDSTHNEYANYKIQLTAQLIGPSNSWKDAYLIYTNAKINPAVIDEP